MLDLEYETLRDWLRVKWIPGDPCADQILRYDDYLALSDAKRSALMTGMSGDELEVYVELETARALYVDPVDRESGITEAKVQRYQERYRWDPSDSA